MLNPEKKEQGFLEHLDIPQEKINAIIAGNKKITQEIASEYGMDMDNLLMEAAKARKETTVKAMNSGGLLEDDRMKYGIAGGVSKVISKLMLKHDKRMAKRIDDSAPDNTEYFNYQNAANMIDQGDITIAEANQMLKSAGYPEKDVQEFTRAYASKTKEKPSLAKDLATKAETRKKDVIFNKPLTDEEIDEALDNLTKRGDFYSGGLLEDDRQMYMEGGDTNMDSDEDMENKYLDFILDEALTDEEEEMLMSKLEQDEQMAMLFDKVIDVAQEFAGSGPVEGPGSGVSDSIPARLSDGEFVFTAKAVEEIGADNLMAMMKDAEMKADERQGLAEGGEPEEEETVVMPVEKSANQQDIRVTKTTVGAQASQQEVNDLVDEEVKKSMLRGSRNLS
jgi:hypothetical protein